MYVFIHSHSLFSCCYDVLSLVVFEITDAHKYIFPNCYDVFRVSCFVVGFEIANGYKHIELWKDIAKMILQKNKDRF